MTPNQNPNPNPKPDPWKQARHYSRALLGLLCAGAIFLSTFYLVSSPGMRNEFRHDFLGFSNLAIEIICIVAGIIFVLGASFVVLRIMVNAIINTMEVISAGRFSPLVLTWFTSIVLGIWGFTMFLLGSIALGYLTRYLFNESAFLVFLLELILWIFFLLCNPLILLVSVRYIQASRQLAARLMLIQAAGLINTGVDPIRALAQVNPSASYLDARQHAIAQALKQNLTFAQAINRNVPYLSSADRKLLLAAERMGILGAVLTRKSHDLQQETKAGMNSFVPSIIVMEWSFLFTIVLLIMIFVIPKYERIFEDFGTDLPLATKTFMYISKFLMGTLPDQAMPGILYILIVLAFIPFVLLASPYIKAALGHVAVQARIPVVGDMVMRTNLVAACSFLAHTLRAGIDLPTAVAQTRTLWLSRAVSARLLAWENQMRAGIAPGDAAQSAGLPPVMAAFIRSAQNGPAMGNAMDRLARYYQNQTSRARIVIENLALPVTLLVTGIVVGAVVIALFLPMAKLIQKLV